MGVVIGMDEAGYGPNLGPLVVTATVWEVTGHPRETNFWAALDDVVQQSLPTDKFRLQVADSKQVYSPSRGIANLEKSVLCALRLLGYIPRSFHELLAHLTNDGHLLSHSEPWYKGQKLLLPYAIDECSIGDVAVRFDQCCKQNGIRLKAIQSDVVLTERFNRMTREFDSKSGALSRISMQLLRQVWNPNANEPTLVLADKHGGRNRYDTLLNQILDGRMIFRLQESKKLSRYRVDRTEIHFQVAAEVHFPVAMASMISKYLRELAMTLFNRFWMDQVPNLKPTKGYPVDARRFKRDISDAQTRQNIPDEILWRER